MSDPSQPSSAPVTCTVDDPKRPRRNDTGAPEGPPPPELEQARGARNSTTLSLLARHADARVRAAVAANPDAPHEALTALSNDPEGAVIEAVAKNPALPDELFVDLYENPRARKGTNHYQVLFNNGERGAYVTGIGTFARALLYLFGAVFFVADLLAYAFGVTEGTHHKPAGNPLALQGFVAAAAGVLLARALDPLGRLTVERLRARSVLPKIGVWCARVAVVALLASQIRTCSAL